MKKNFMKQMSKVIYIPYKLQRTDFLLFFIYLCYLIIKSHCLLCIKKIDEQNIEKINAYMQFIKFKIFWSILQQELYMKKIVLLLALLCIATSIYTSSYWAKKAANKPKAAQPQQQFIQSINIDTVCNQVDLSAKPYEYNGTVMSGYLKVNKGNSALGFIFYGRQHTPKADIPKHPIILWLNGGPGSSSQLGNFMELGPHFIQPAHMTPYEIVKNNQSWVKDYNVIFVDQPVGTGLSYADPAYSNDTAYCKSMADVAQDFWLALNELYLTTNGCFKKLNISPNQDLFIFGQSYAGKYAPAIAQRIKRQQQDHNGFLTGLKGVGIGDGFTMPYTILSEVGEYAYNLGLIDYQERARVEQMIINATFQDRIQAWNDTHDSFDNILDYIVEKAGGINVYDITKYHDYPDILIEQFLGQPDTKKLFSINRDIDFGSQSERVYMAMYQDFMKPYVHLVQELLRRKTHVLIYNGQNDLIVETPGTFKWVERIHYENAEQFRETLFSVWKTGTKTSGYKKQAGYLELKTVNNAGHLVPMDQGQASLNMVKTFVRKCTGRGGSVEQE